MDLVIEPLTSGWLTAMGWARALSKTQRGTVNLKRQTVRESRRGLRLRRSHFSMNRQMDFVPRHSGELGNFPSAFEKLSWTQAE